MNALIERGRARAHDVGAGPLARVWAVVLLAAVAAGLLFASPALADPDEDTANLSMYKLSSSLSSYLGNTQSPEETDHQGDVGESWQGVLDNPGNAGAFLGYADPDLTELFKWATSQLSGSSGTIAYKQFCEVKAGEEGGSGSCSQKNGLLSYAQFGATLDGLGLDSTSTSLSTSIFRTMGGGIMLVLLGLSMIVDLIFWIALGVLNLLNPFRLFADGMKAVFPSTFTDGIPNNTDLPVPFNILGYPLEGLVSWIGGWYGVLYNLSWSIVMPLMIGMLVITLIFFKKVDRGEKIKKLVVRLLFLGLGLPLLGTTYSAAIANMQESVLGIGRSGSAQVIMSTYVDFQGWVNDSRLNIPDCATIEWNYNAGQPTAEAMMNVRNTALCINGEISGYGQLTPQLNENTANSWTQSIMEGADSANEGGERDPSLPPYLPSDPASQFVNMSGMLVRYMYGATISASDFETTMKGDLTNLASEDELGSEKVGSWFKDFTPGKPRELYDLEKDKVNGNPLLGGGTLTAETEGTTKTFTSDGGTCLAFWAAGRDGQAMECTLSPMSMYNYLNTSFSPDSLVTYSSEKAASGAIRESHTAVNQVGTGSMKVLYWINAVVLLLAFVVIGIGYALALMFANIKRGIQLMGAIPFATIGTLSGIAKVVAYSIAMVLEILVTVFAYVLVQNLLFAIPQILEAPLALVLNQDKGVVGISAALLTAATFITTSGLAPMMITVISIVVLAWFTIVAMRVRKTMVKTINETVTKLVEKFTSAEIHAGGGGMPGGGLMPSLAQGAAAAGGMAAGNRIMNKVGGNNSGGGSKNGGQGGPNAKGPGSIGVGGVPGMGGDTFMGGDNAQLSSNEESRAQIEAGDDYADGDGNPTDPQGSAGDAQAVDGADGQDPQAADGTDGRGVDGEETTGMSQGEARDGLEGSGSDKELADQVRGQGSLKGDGTEGVGDAAKQDGGALEGAESSIEADREVHKEQDKATRDQALAGGAAAVKAGEAAGRAYSGDAAGAVGAAGEAAGKAGEAKGAGDRRKELGKKLEDPTVNGGKTDGNQAPKKTSGSSSPSPSSDKGTSTSAAGAAGNPTKTTSNVKGGSGQSKSGQNGQTRPSGGTKTGGNQSSSSSTRSQSSGGVTNIRGGNAQGGNTSVSGGSNGTSTHTSSSTERTRQEKPKNPKRPRPGQGNGSGSNGTRRNQDQKPPRGGKKTTGSSTRTVTNRAAGSTTGSKKDSLGGASSSTKGSSTSGGRNGKGTGKGKGSTTWRPGGGKGKPPFVPKKKG